MALKKGLTQKIHILYCPVKLVFLLTVSVFRWPAGFSCRKRHNKLSQLAWHLHAALFDHVPQWGKYAPLIVHIQKAVCATWASWDTLLFAASPSIRHCQTVLLFVTIKHSIVCHYCSIKQSHYFSLFSIIVSNSPIISHHQTVPFLSRSDSLIVQTVPWFVTIGTIICHCQSVPLLSLSVSPIFVTIKQSHYLSLSSSPIFLSLSSSPIIKQSHYLSLS